ncbi:MAG: DUF1674 domain-containing protein [Gammaproteobacteria bacterium]|nr:MAG: DUF1674 domain-containing protein [Gammaproteobacteria bacterium]
MPETPRAEERVGSTQIESSRVPANPASAESKPMPREIDGRAGLEPTRYGDWEKGGRCIDF